MFGVCYLTVEPLPRGEGIEFVDEIVGGAIPRNLIPAVEKGVLEACAAGPLAGYPVVDVRVRCIDGKHHSVDSNEMAFKLAGSFGFKAAIEQAAPDAARAGHEPRTSSVPDQYVGDVMGDLSSRRGRVGSSEAQGSTQVIRPRCRCRRCSSTPARSPASPAARASSTWSSRHYDEAPGPRAGAR